MSLGAADCDQLLINVLAGQRKRFLGEVARFLQKSQKEQELRLANRVPTLAEYWDYRLGSSAVFISLAVDEYSSRSCLKPRVYDSPYMQAIWTEMNVIISLMNDLISIKKELLQDNIESYIPLACASGKGVQDAIADAVRQLELSKQRFDEAEVDLIQYCKQNSLLSFELTDFIEVCKSNCVGNILWR